MKKLLVILVAVCGMAVNVSAARNFRWSGCSKTGLRVDLYDNGSVIYHTRKGSYRGTYRWSQSVDGKSGTMTILMPELETRWEVDVYDCNDVGNSPQRIVLSINGIEFSRWYCN